MATRKKKYIGKVNNYFSKLSVAEIKIEASELNLQDEIIISGPTTGVYEDVLQEIRVDLKPTTKAKQGDVCSIPVKSEVRRNDKLYIWIENKVDAE